MVGEIILNESFQTCEKDGVRISKVHTHPLLFGSANVTSGDMTFTTGTFTAAIELVKCVAWVAHQSFHDLVAAMATN